VDSPTRIDANISIEPLASLGARDVTITGPNGTGVGAGLFTIVLGAPLVRQISTSSATRDSSFFIVILGQDFDGATSVSFGAGVTVDRYEVDSPTRIDANISIEPLASLGARDVTITGPNGTGVGAGLFTVTNTTPGGLTLPCGTIGMSSFLAGFLWLVGIKHTIRCRRGERLA
jgi:hypothetical protein